MRLRRIGAHAHALETPAGALLFSYEDLAAVRRGALFYTPRGGPMTTATRAHVAGFRALSGAAPNSGPFAVDARLLEAYARAVLEAA